MIQDGLCRNDNSLPCECSSPGELAQARLMVVAGPEKLKEETERDGAGRERGGDRDRQRESGRGRTEWLENSTHHCYYILLAKARCNGSKYSRVEEINSTSKKEELAKGMNTIDGKLGSVLYQSTTRGRRASPSSSCFQGLACIRITWSSC